MKPETKIKALTAIVKAGSEMSSAINQGRFSKIEFIINDLKAELRRIKISGFEDGGFFTSRFSFDGAIVDEAKGEEFILNKRKPESKERFEKRKAITAKNEDVRQLFDRIKGIYNQEEE